MLMLRRLPTRLPCLLQFLTARRYNTVVTDAEVAKTWLWTTPSFRLLRCDLGSLSGRRPCVVARRCTTSSGYISGRRVPVPSDDAELEALLEGCRQQSTVDLIGVMTSVAGVTKQHDDSQPPGSPDIWTGDQQKRTVIGALLNELVQRLQQQQQQQEAGGFDWAAITRLAKRQIVLSYLREIGEPLFSQLAMVLLEASSGMAADRAEIGDIFKVITYGGPPIVSRELQALYPRHLAKFAQNMLELRRRQLDVLLFLCTVHRLTPPSYQIKPELMGQLMDEFVRRNTGEGISTGLGNASSFLLTCSCVSALLVRMRIRDSTFLSAFEQTLLPNLARYFSIKPAYAAALAHSLAFFGGGGDVISLLARPTKHGKLAAQGELAASNVRHLVQLAWAILAAGSKPPGPLMAKVADILLFLSRTRRALDPACCLEADQLLPFLRPFFPALAGLDVERLLFRPFVASSWRLLEHLHAQATQGRVKLGVQHSTGGLITLAALARPSPGSPPRQRGVETLPWPVDPAALSPTETAALPGTPVAVLLLNGMHKVRDRQGNVEHSFVMRRHAHLLRLAGWHVAFLDLDLAVERSLECGEDEFWRLLAQAVLRPSLPPAPV